MGQLHRHRRKRPQTNQSGRVKITICLTGHLLYSFPNKGATAAMSELTSVLFANRLPKILLITWLGLAGCQQVVNSSIRDRLMPDLDCGAKPTNSQETTYHKMTIGERILLGHANSTGNGPHGDAVAELAPGGKIITTATGRTDIASPATPVITEEKNGTRIVVSDENYFITTKQPSPNTFDVNVVGKCPQAPQ